MILTRRTIFFVKLKIIFLAIIWIFAGFSLTYKNSNCNNFEILTSKLGRSKLTTKDQFYNLLPINNDLLRSSSLTEDCCNEDFANSHQLQQNHPCVIEIIRKKYLYYPPLAEISLHLDHPSDVDPSAGQAAAILPYLKNKTDGFFIECGAGDGETLSNTLFMERYLNWKGILIEADNKFFSQILTKKRKAFAVRTCLSLKPYPTKVSFFEDGIAGMIIEEKIFSLQEIAKNESFQIVNIQCFPLYSILLAVGNTQVDYFSVDVEGSELQVLRSIPWHKVNIKTLTVEVTSRSDQVVKFVSEYMGIQGYKKIGLMQGLGYYDLIFVKKD